MAKPFGNMAQLTGDILDSYIMGLQAGSTPDDAGLDEMKYVRVDKLRRYIREGLVTAYTPRDNSSSATPSSPQVGDIFMCTGEFTESGVTYQLNHFYVYTTQLAWEDITAGIKGPKGDIGVTPLLSIGEVTYGDTPNVTIDTTDPTHPVMNFVLKTSEVGVVDNLTSNSAVDALSAKQGKLLKTETTALQSQIVNTNAELDNVEALIGGDAQVENTDPTEGESLLAQSRLIHHANLLPNGNFGRVGARSVAWNQLVKNGNFVSADGWVLESGVTASFNDNAATISSTIENNGIRRSVDFITGHKYLVSADVSTESAITVRLGSNSSSGVQLSFTPTVFNQYIKYSGVLTALNDYYTFFIFAASPYTNLKVRNVTLYDLTAMGLESISADQFRALFPASYYPYDTGHIYDLNPSGFRIRAVNLFSEEMVLGSINSSGSEISSNVAMRSSNYDSCSGNKAYYFLKPTGVYFAIYWYDAEKHFISAVGYRSGNAGIETAPSTACYFRLVCGDNQIAYTSYNHDIQIADNSLSTSVKTTYHAYDGHVVETPQIADGHYANKNCYDYVENVTEDGIVKGKKHTVVGAVDLGTLTYTYEGGLFRSTSLSSLMKLPSSGTVKGNMLCKRYVTITSHEISSSSVMSIAINTNGLMYVADSNYTSVSSFVAGISGITLYYELATEVVTDCEPLRSFGISDYSTVEPITPQDELVNRIDVPFSVKSVSANTLIGQITQNTADIAEEKAIRSAQVSALDKRVTNLELKTGDLLPVPYPSDSYGMDGVPANVAEYAKVTKLRGVTRVENQLCRNPMFTDDITGWYCTRGTIAYDSGRCKYTITEIGGSDNISHRINKSIEFIANHIYLIAFDIQSPRAGNAGCDAYSAGIGYNFAFPFSANVRTQIQRIATATTTTTAVFDIGFSGYDSQFGYQVGDIIYFDNVILRDLTQYFSSDPSVDVSTLTISDIQTNYPWLLTPSDYGTSGVNTVYEGVVSKARNLWDESHVYGSINESTGQDSENGNTSYWRSEGYIPINPNTTYYQNTDGYVGNFRHFFYDANKNFIGFTVPTAISQHGGYGVEFTSPSGAFYMRFRFSTPLTNYKNCINKSDSQNGTYTPYWTPRTLSFPSTTLKSAGSVRDTLELNVEVKVGDDWVYKRRDTQRIGTYTFTGNETFGYESSSKLFYMSKPNGMANISSNSQVANIMCQNFVATSVNGARADLGGADKTISQGYITASSQICIRDDSKNGDTSALASSLTGLTFNFELAEYVVTLSDPVEDPYVKVEPNGTIKAVQSQSPEVDSAMTVEYMAS